MRELLELLEAGPSNSLLLGLAWLAGQSIEHNEDEQRAALRRAELLLATGGDPRRELDLDDRAVTSVAADLDEEAAREQLEDSLGWLAKEAEGLPGVTRALAELRAQPELAWQCYAAALLADAIASG